MYAIKANKITYNGEDVATIIHANIPQMEQMVQSLNFIDELLNGEVNDIKFETAYRQSNLDHLEFKVNGVTRFQIPVIDLYSLEKAKKAVLQKIVMIYVTTDNDQ